MTSKFRNVGLKNRIFARTQKTENLIAVAESEGVAIFFRLCRGPLAGARARTHDSSSRYTEE